MAGTQEREGRGDEGKLLISCMLCIVQVASCEHRTASTAEQPQCSIIPFPPACSPASYKSPLTYPYVAPAPPTAEPAAAPSAPTVPTAAPAAARPPHPGNPMTIPGNPVAVPREGEESAPAPQANAQSGANTNPPPAPLPEAVVFHQLMNPGVPEVRVDLEG
jgi:hypothetical protein